MIYHLKTSITFGEIEATSGYIENGGEVDPMIDKAIKFLLQEKL